MQNTFCAEKKQMLFIFTKEKKEKRRKYAIGRFSQEKLLLFVEAVGEETVLNLTDEVKKKLLGLVVHGESFSFSLFFFLFHQRPLLK